MLVTGCASPPDPVVLACQEKAGLEPDDTDDLEYWDSYVGHCVEFKRAIHKLATGR